MEAKERHVHSEHGIQHVLRHTGQRRKGGEVGRLLHIVQRQQLRRAGSGVDTSQLMCGANDRLAQVLGKLENIAQGMIDDLNQADEQKQLHKNRNDAQKGVVPFLLIELSLLFGDGVPIAEVTDLDAVDPRLHAHHLDAVLVHPQRHREENDLA